MELLIISGLSGAGKSQAAAILEDFDFYCVDNMPVELIPKFVEICMKAKGKYEKTALVTDIRINDPFDKLFKTLDHLRTIGCKYSILYMTASSQTILNRYKESRRPHPLMEADVSLEQAVNMEREMMKEMRGRADYVLDSTGLTLGQLRGYLRGMFLQDNKSEKLNINVMSFGFKNGLPLEADLVLDVRFLPNPFYLPELRHLTGYDQPIKDYIFSQEDAKDFITHLADFMGYLLPHYMEEGKISLTVCFGCTGGHHRSVAVAELFSKMAAKWGYPVHIHHRDINI